MQRRSLLTTLAAGGVAAASGLVWVAQPKMRTALALDRTLDQLSGLDPTTLSPAGPWDVARTLAHLAQSVEFSMTGYPEQRSPMFQKTVGRLAFNVFQTRGQMSHGVDEPIPGEQIAAELGPEAALARLTTALIRFRDFDGPVQAHFAYGVLSKDEYAKAHVMHVQDHLEELRVAEA